MNRESLAVDIDNPTAWMQAAVCKEIPSAMFPADGDKDGEEVAKQVCASCEVSTDCLDFALVQREKFGVWGGATERERRQIVKERRKLARLGGAAIG